MEATERDPVLVSQLSAKLQSERAACEAERAAVAKDVAAARAYNEKIRAEFMLKREERAALDKAVLDAESRAHGARKALAQAEVKEAVATAVVEHKNAQQEQLAGFINLLHQQERQVKEQQQQVIEAQVAASKYKFECSDLLRDLGNLRDAHEKETSKLRTALDAAKTEVLALQKSLEEAKQHSAQHENQLRVVTTSARSEATSALAQVEDLRRELREARGRLMSGEKEIAVLRNETSDAKGRLLAGEREIERLRNEASMAKLETTAALQKLDAFHRGYQEAEHRTTFLQDEAKSRSLLAGHLKSVEASSNWQQISAPRRNRREVAQGESAGLSKTISAPLPRDVVPATSSTKPSKNEANSELAQQDKLKIPKADNADASAISFAGSHSAQLQQLGVHGCEVSDACPPQELAQEQHEQIRPSGVPQCVSSEQHKPQPSAETVVAIESKSIIVRSNANVILDRSKMTALGFTDRDIVQGEPRDRNFDQIVATSRHFAQGEISAHNFEQMATSVAPAAHNVDQIAATSKPPLQKQYFEEKRLATTNSGLHHSAAFIQHELANMQQVQSSTQRWQQRAQITEGTNSAAGTFDLRTIIERVSTSPADGPNANTFVSQRDVANHFAVSRNETGMPPRKRPREADEWIPPTASSTASTCPQRLCSPRHAERIQDAQQKPGPSQFPSQLVQRVQPRLQEQQQLQRELERDAGGGRRPKRSKSKVERQAHMLYPRKPQAKQLRGAPLHLYQAHVDHVLDRWERYEQLHKPNHVSEEQREHHRRHTDQHTAQHPRQLVDRPQAAPRQYVDQPQAAPFHPHYADQPQATLQMQLQREQRLQQQPRILVASGR